MLLFLLGVVLLACVVWAIWDEKYKTTPEYKQKLREKENEERLKRMEDLNKLAQKYGADNFIESIKIGKGCSIDKQHKLMCYTYRYSNDYTDYNAVIPLSNIEHCHLQEHYATRDKSISVGLKDGILAGITGAGVIRDSNSLSETYATGNVVMEIKFINIYNKYDYRSFIFDDVIYAKRLKSEIDSLL